MDSTDTPTHPNGAANGNGETAASNESISADEIALYDRQIRLWGVQAQENLRKANVLVIRLKALANEVAKNLVLAGIHSITVLDHEVVTENDLGAQFFVSDSSVGQNRAVAALPEIQKLNNRVKVTADTDDVYQKADLGAYFAPFDLVIATDLPFQTTLLVSAACRLVNKPSYVSGTHGLYGYIFADLIRHTFTVEREKFNAPTRIGPETLTRSILSSTTKKEKGELKEIVMKQEDYTPLILANTSPLPLETTKLRRRLRLVTPLLSCLRALWDFEKEHSRLPTLTPADLKEYTMRATEKHRELQLPIETLKSEFLRSFLQNLGSEIAPVTAVLGGLLSQDAINVLGKREQPIQNLVLFDGEEYAAPMYALHPVFNDGLDAVVTRVDDGGMTTLPNLAGTSVANSGGAGAGEVTVIS